MLVLSAVLRCRDYCYKYRLLLANHFPVNLWVCFQGPEIYARLYNVLNIKKLIQIVRSSYIHFTPITSHRQQQATSWQEAHVTKQYLIFKLIIVKLPRTGLNIPYFAQNSLFISRPISKELSKQATTGNKIQKLSQNSKYKKQ